VIVAVNEMTGISWTDDLHHYPWIW